MSKALDRDAGANLVSWDSEDDDEPEPSTSTSPTSPEKLASCQKSPAPASTASSTYNFSQMRNLLDEDFPLNDLLENTDECIASPPEKPKPRVVKTPAGAQEALRSAAERNGYPDRTKRSAHTAIMLVENALGMKSSSYSKEQRQKERERLANAKQEKQIVKKKAAETQKQIDEAFS